jgi:hypothetical protein
MTSRNQRTRNPSWKPGVEILEERRVPSSSSWNNFGGNAQHTGISGVAANPMDTILWQTSIDKQPSGAEHYGEPVFTRQNTVIIPIKTGTSGGFTIEGVNGSTGAVIWSAATDYQEPAYDWLPPFQSVYDPVNDRVYFAGNGGTTYYISHPDNPGSSSPTPVQLAFYGIAKYDANKSAFNASIFVNSPLTVDSSGNVFFGFTETGSNPAGITQGGIARIGADGSGNWVLASTAAGSGSNVDQAALGSVPALSNDGTVVYAVLNNSGNSYNAYLVGLNSATLAATYSVNLVDPSSGNPAGAIPESTASPMVGPDNTVFLGVFGNPYNGSRGYLLHFSADLTQKYTPGAFGWDDTPSIIPPSMVPSYHGTSSYLILSKYNNYVTNGSLGGNGVNQIAILDPYASEPDPNNDNNPKLQVMKEILTLPSPTPDTDFNGSGYLDAVREWCTDGTAVDPSTDSVFINNEDGYAYRWNLSSNVLTQAVEITNGIGEPYTPTAIGPDGTIYAINGGTLFALGGYANYAETFVSSPHPSVVGQSITFTATLKSTSGGPTPTGSITFSYTEGANDPRNSMPVVMATVDLVNGVASYSTSSLPADHFHVTAAYSGDSTYGPGSATRVQAVLDTTTVVLTSSAPFAAAGSSVTFTATLTPTSTSFVPMGFVTFKDGSTVLGTVPLPALDQPNFSTTTQVIFTTSALSVGAHSITAFYGGDMNLARKTSAVLVETINGTTTSLSSSVNPSVFGQSVIFTATVTPISTSGTPTGMVTFKAGSTTLGTATLSGGTAFISTSGLAVGASSITASYSGDPNDAGSTSSALSQTVNKDGTTTSVVSSANPSVFGQSVTFTATVTANAPGSGIPPGKVTFKDNGVVVGTITLDANGQAAFTTSALSLYNNKIVAVYTGSAKYTMSSSAVLVQVVNRDATSITLSSSTNPSVLGQSVTFTVTVVGAPPGSGIPTGTITFYDGSKSLGTATVDSTGTATLAISNLTIGVHNITATYSGDADYKYVKSSILAQSVVAPGSPDLAALLSSFLDKSAIDKIFGA